MTRLHRCFQSRQIIERAYQVANDLLRVIMLGNRGVGKTSLLASMYDEFEGSIDAGFTLSIPDMQTAEMIDTRLAQLKGVMDAPDTTIKPMIGNREESTYRFTLTRERILGTLARPPLDIQFFDYPGAWTIASNPGNKQVQEQLAQSLATIIVIDSPALMHEGGKYNDIVNIPKQINTIMQNTLETHRKHLILFVPMKCETYVETDIETTLIECIHKAYSPLISYIVENNFASAILPVRTLGNVRFKGYEAGVSGSLEAVFEKTTPKARYSPRDSDQPLKYILNFLFKYYRDKSNDDWGFFKGIRDWAGKLVLDTDIDSMFANVSLRINQEPPFEIISGREQFKL